MIEFDAENPTEQDLRQIDIHKLLPQQEPFVMIDTLTHFDRTLTVTETEVKENNIFVDFMTLQLWRALPTMVLPLF